MNAATRAHLVAQERLRATTARGVGLAWDGLGKWDEVDVEPFLARVVPFVTGAQRQSIALTNAYVARLAGRRPLALDPSRITGAAVRNGTTPEEVYRRPFVTVWTALSKGTAFEDALAAGRARSTGAAAMDVQLSHRATYGELQRADRSIRGYERAPDGGACTFCLAVAGAFVKSADAMALHGHCGCGLEPIFGEAPDATPTPDTVAVHEHGELGAVLAAPGDHFTTEAQIA